MLLLDFSIRSWFTIKFRERLTVLKFMALVKQEIAKHFRVGIERTRLSRQPFLIAATRHIQDETA
jgi:hypothetical protein